MEFTDPPWGETSEDSASKTKLPEKETNIKMLVDSRDITELQLKQSDCELLIRKKEALLPLEPASPIVMPQNMAPAMFQTPPPAAAPAPAPATPTLPALAPSSPPPGKAGRPVTGVTQILHFVPFCY
ncbi:hypothetical protein CCACVL1_09298 [Corchorus capsularis]|uniref:Uncharacterized protein n=1 Tax=Corchorus capsularis TaxID=210143 RepID=A0A1R3IWV8_COCAP|nr:hypothetical protein CCACVL1_09298 [Corchorus capsularis]